MNERTARRQWIDPTAKEAVINAQGSILSQLDEQIAAVEAKKAAGGKVSKQLRGLRNRRRKIIYG
ncbi:hypothetical protein HYW44_02625 [Candidatus Daviesbacteria bacterium]|nr:hypothetical protein [Candidatus Daviesbacteria bacterium]